jgi:hypothetical protein
MKIFIVTALMALLPLTAVSQHAPLQGNGWGWGQLSDNRRLGFIEGFDYRLALDLDLGTFDQNAPMKVACRLDPTKTECALHRLEANTHLEVPFDKTVDMVSAVYAQHQNLPLTWGHAVVIAKAMVCGLPIPETLLKALRQEDAASVK